MPIRKKDQKIDDIRHSSGEVVSLMFNPNTSGENALTFSAKFGGNEWRATSATEVKQLVLSYLNSISKMDWVPVITVSETEPFGVTDRAHFIGFNVDRCYMSISGKKVLRRLNWSQYDAGTCNPTRRDGEGMDIYRIKMSTIMYGKHETACETIDQYLPHKSDGGHTITMRYSEHVWVALNELRENISKMRRSLHDLLMSPDGHARLSRIGAQINSQLLIGAGAEEEVA